MVGLSDYRPRQAMSPAMRTFGRKTPAQMAQQQLDDHAYFRDQTHDLKMGAIQQPYSQNAATYGSMGVPTQQKMGLRDYASKIQSGMRPGLRLGPEQVTPSQSALLAGRGGDYGPDPSVPPASHYAYTGLPPQLRQVSNPAYPEGPKLLSAGGPLVTMSTNARGDSEFANGNRASVGLPKFTEGNSFLSNSGNGQTISVFKDASGKIRLRGSPLSAAKKAEQQSAIAQASQRANERRQVANDNRMLAYAMQNGLNMNHPGFRAAMERRGGSTEQKRFAQVAMNARLNDFNSKVARKRDLENQMSQLQADIVTGKRKDKTEAWRQHSLLQNMVDQLHDEINPPPQTRRGIAGMAPAASGVPRFRSMGNSLTDSIQP